MSEPFIGEIRAFPYNFAPRGWAMCDGQLIPIAENTELFAIIGTIYGGDGRTTLALPNLQDRIPIHGGRGPGLTSRQLGQRGGAPTVALNETQTPEHNHFISGTRNQPTSNVPTGLFVSKHKDDNVAKIFKTDPTIDATMSPGALMQAGQSQDHNNLPPVLSLTFCIALAGTFPSRG